MWVCGLDWVGPGQGQVAEACEYGNEPSGSMKCGEFLDQLQTSQLLKKDSVPWSKSVLVFSTHNGDDTPQNCKCKFPACNAHAPYCNLWPARLYYIFPRVIINGTLFDKTLWNINCVFRLSLQLFPGAFLILGRTERDMIRNVYWYPR